MFISHNLAKIAARNATVVAPIAPKVARPRPATAAAGEKTSRKAFLAVLLNALSSWAA